MKNDFPITQTKLLVPRRRSDLISRQRLLDFLYEILELKLIIVSAPAGYGKTSLLIDLIYRSNWKFCWFMIDKLDQDLYRFLQHFISSIASQFPTFGKKSFSVISNMTQDQLNIDLMISVIINDIFENINEHIVIVLDDYHLVDSSDSVSYFVSNFIQNMGENCHFILSSRTLLSLPDLPLMVARSQVGGLSQDELTFTPKEIQTLMLENFSQKITEAEALELAYHTEGWITGLLLSSKTAKEGISNRLRVAKASGIGLYEYLAQQVFEKQNQSVQSFLMRTSLLEEFNNESCKTIIEAALQEKMDWADHIRYIFQENLFIQPVGEDSVWLRYHNLFQTFLQNRLRTKNSEEYFKIQNRRGEIEQKKNNWEKAYEIYEELQSIDEIVKLLEIAGSSMLSDGKLITLSNWLDALPSSILHNNPILKSLQGSVYVMRGVTDEGLELLNDAVNNLSQESDHEMYTTSLLRRAIALRLVGKLEKSLIDSDSVIELSQSDPSLSQVWAEAMRAKGTTLFQLGKVNHTLDCFKAALNAYQRSDDTHNASILRMELGLAYKTNGDFVAAENSYQQAYKFWKRSENSTWLANLLNNWGELQYTIGEFALAAETLEEAILHAKKSGYQRMEAYSLTTLGDLYRDVETPHEAQDTYNQAQKIALKIRDSFLDLYIEIAKGTLAILEKDHFRAKKIFSSAKNKTEISKSSYEKHLYYLERGVFDFSNRHYIDCIQLLQETSSFFFNAGFNVEAFRSRFILSAALFLNNQIKESKKQFELVIQFLNDSGYYTPLINCAKIIRPHFNKLKKDLYYSEYISLLQDHLDQYDRSLIKIKKNFRKNSTIVVFNSPKLIIRTFGKIEISLNDQTVSGADWKSQTARDLLLLLLSKSEGMTKEMIGEIFWPDSSPAELKMRFKNTIYRLRHAVGKDTIQFLDSMYRFNFSIEYDYDTDTFRKEIYLAEKAESPQQKINHYRSAIKVYAGKYLPGLDDIWALTERQSLEDIYLNTLLTTANLYLSLNDSENALTHAQKILLVDSCHEEAHRLIMQIHSSSGNKAAIIRQYEQCKKTLEEELQTFPSDSTKELYELLIN